VEPRFQEHFVDALSFPHRTAAYPHLSTLVDIPARRAAAARGADARADRRRQRAAAIATANADREDV
jgi:uncharacterized 2Fe-2S/4Fe-4S cluster protein (DUF4445 family)